MNDAKSVVFFHDVEEDDPELDQYQCFLQVSINMKTVSMVHLQTRDSAEYTWVYPAIKGFADDSIWIFLEKPSTSKNFERLWAIMLSDAKRNALTKVKLKLKLFLLQKIHTHSYLETFDVYWKPHVLTFFAINSYKKAVYVFWSITAWLVAS